MKESKLWIIIDYACIHVSLWNRHIQMKVSPPDDDIKCINPNSVNLIAHCLRTLHIFLILCLRFGEPLLMLLCNTIALSTIIMVMYTEGEFPMHYSIFQELNSNKSYANHNTKSSSFQVCTIKRAMMQMFQKWYLRMSSAAFGKENLFNICLFTWFCTNLFLSRVALCPSPLITTSPPPSSECIWMSSTTLEEASSLFFF